jgi:hypothetical protein
VLYLKHNSKLRQAVEELRNSGSGAYAALRPFLEENDDISSFQEVRTAVPIDVKEAVWLLTTLRSEEDRKRPLVPGVDIFQAKYVAIAQSFWHRSHQLGILSEWQFVTWTKDEDMLPESYRFLGEHYWRQDVTKRKELTVTLPVHERKIIFDCTHAAESGNTYGPCRFIDVARFVAKVLSEAGEDFDATLPYRLIQDVVSI